MNKTGTTRVTTTNGVTFITKSNDTYVSKSLEVYGEWSYGEITFLSQLLNESDNVVEAGANIGAHTVFLAKELVPNGIVFAFEPRRVLFQTLCGNLALNSLENVHAYDLALSDKPDAQAEGRIDFSAKLNLGGYALGDFVGNQEEIKIQKLDNLIDPKKVIALIKADIQGYELKLLIGSDELIKRDRPFLYLENEDPKTSFELISYLWKLEYDCWWDIVPLFNPNNRANTQQNIFPNISSFNMFCAPREKRVNVDISKIVDATSHPLSQN